MDSKSDATPWIFAECAEPPRLAALRIAEASMYRKDCQEMMDRACVFLNFISRSHNHLMALKLAAKYATERPTDEIVANANTILVFLREEDGPQAVREAA